MPSRTTNRRPDSLTMDLRSESVIDIIGIATYYGPMQDKDNP